MPNIQDFYEQLLHHALDFFHDHKYHKALGILDKLIHLPDVSHYLKTQAYRYKGNCLSCLEKYQDAIQCLDRALFLIEKNGPEKYLTIACKGWCLFKLGKHEEALRWYDRALSLVTNKADFQSLEFETQLILSDYETKRRDEFVERTRSTFEQEVESKKRKLQEFVEDQVFTDDMTGGKPVLKS
jgi:tetratricopeptide (TPR) repeat protein